MVDLLLDAVCIVNADSRIVFVSPSFERIFGYTPQEAVGRRMLDMVHPDDLATTEQQARAVMAGNLQLQFENRYVRKDGTIAHILWTARWLPEQQLRLALAHDITDRKLSEAVQAAVYALSEAAHQAPDLLALLQGIHQIIGRLLPARHFSVALYNAATDMLSVPYHASDSPHPQGSTPPWHHALCAQVIHSASALLITPQHRPPPPLSSDAVPAYWLGVPLQAPQGPMGALVLYSDGAHGGYTDKDKGLLQFMSTQIAAVIERQQMYERLKHMAQYDQLTHLPNRQLFLDRLKTALARARRDQALLSLLFIDLDRFKDVNDTLGHAMGDLLLQRVAQRLLECVRESDTVARLGGDEFVVLLESTRVREHATAAAQKILAAFGRAFDLEGLPVDIRPSIGVAIYPDHGDEEHRLLSHADEAMYLSKQVGGNQVKVAPGPAAAAGPAPGD